MNKHIHKQVSFSCPYCSTQYSMDFYLKDVIYEHFCVKCCNRVFNTINGKTDNCNEINDTWFK